MSRRARRGRAFGPGFALAFVALVVAAFALAAGCSAYDEADYLRETSASADGRAPLDATMTLDGAAPVDGAVRLDGSMSDGGAPEASASDAASCLPPDAGDPCMTIPSLPGPQVVDGLATEFCQVPTRRFDPSQGNLDLGSADIGLLNPTPIATLQVAWTPQGLALFVHVAEPAVHVAEEGQPIYLGDSVAFFVAPMATLLTGNPDSDPGALQFIVAPASPDGGSAYGYSYASNIDVPPSQPIPPETLAARVVDGVNGGYDVELAIPFSSLVVGASPFSGDKIGFDFGLNMRVPTLPVSDEDSAQSFLFQRKDLDNSPCGSPPFYPFCDDRTWCTPTLQ